MNTTACVCSFVRLFVCSFVRLFVCLFVRLFVLFCFCCAGMNEDFLLIILKDVLRRRPDLKLVLMSATLNAAMFARYKKRSFLNSKKHIHLRKR